MSFPWCWNLKHNARSENKDNRCTKRSHFVHSNVDCSKFQTNYKDVSRILALSMERLCGEQAKQSFISFTANMMTIPSRGQKSLPHQFMWMYFSDCMEIKQTSRKENTSTVDRTLMVYQNVNHVNYVGHVKVSHVRFTRKSLERYINDSTSP